MCVGGSNQAEPRYRRTIIMTPVERLVLVYVLDVRSLPSDSGHVASLAMRVRASVGVIAANCMSENTFRCSLVNRCHLLVTRCGAAPFYVHRPLRLTKARGNGHQQPIYALSGTAPVRKCLDVLPPH